MKKIYFSLLLFVAFTACSFSAEQIPFLPTATPPPSPTETSTPTRTLTPTPAPTKPTATFTPTPTLIGYKSPTPTPMDTFTPTITMTVTDIYAHVTPFTPTPNVSLKGFDWVRTSSDVFYKGAGGCQPASVKFTAQTTNKTKASFVQLFVRLESKTSGAQSGWTSLPMESDEMNIFTYTLTPEEIKSADAYENPWVQYQLVAVNVSGKEVGRTGVFTQYLTLLRCVPTETPTP